MVRNLYTIVYCFGWYLAETISDYLNVWILPPVNSNDLGENRINLLTLKIQLLNR
jgi:hypothetical protein